MGQVAHMVKKQFTSKFFAQKALNPLSLSIPLLKHWFNKPLGQSLLTSEKQHIDKVCQDLFGPYLLQMSMLPDEVLCEADNFSQRLGVGPISGDHIHSLARETQIPLAHESIDLAVVHHMMEYSQAPHQFLQELTRIIKPSGYIVIIGFNPWSMLGLRSLSRVLSKHQHWQNHAISARRISDWLRLMNFTICDIQYGFHQLPFNLSIKNHLFNRATFFLQAILRYFGGFYLVVAKKEVAPLTPSTDYLLSIRKSMIPLMEPSLYTDTKKHHLKKKLHD